VGRPPQLEQTSVLRNGPRLRGGQGLRGSGCQQVATPQTGVLLPAGDGLRGLVVQRRRTQQTELDGILGSVRDDLDVGAVLNRWACRLQQPRQRQPMRSREFQGLAPGSGAARTAAEKRAQSYAPACS